jgi:hypothetical protein
MRLGADDKLAADKISQAFRGSDLRQLGSGVMRSNLLSFLPNIMATGTLTISASLVD